MKTVNLLFMLFLLASSAAYSQVTQEWLAVYNGPSGNRQDEATDIFIDSQGNVYVTGNSEGTGGIDDYATVKYNSAGVQQWVARYNGTGNGLDFANAVAVDNFGNVYVTGQTTAPGNHRNYTTIKYNAAGVELWVVHYNGPVSDTDIAYDIALDNNGNVYVTGKSYGGNTTYDDYLTIKYDSAGAQLWTARYNGPGSYNDTPNRLAVDAQGNVYVTGSSSGTGTFSDFTTVKYNSSGAQQWAARYAGNSSDISNAIVLDLQGNVYVTGYSTNATPNRDYLTIKYNFAGTQQWEARYNGAADLADIANGVALDALGNVYVTGQSMGSANDDYVTIKYNPLGVQQWEAKYNGPGNLADIPRDITTDALGNVYVTGGSDGSGSFRDYTTIKYNSAGTEQWLQRYSGTGNGGDVAVKIAVDAQSRVYITGQCLGSGTSDDYVTIKYSQTVGIQNVSSEIPDKFSLSQNYPNPFNPVTHFEFAIADFGFVTLKVYDIMGREIETIVSENLQAGVYKADFDGSTLTSGAYFYRLQAGGFIETKRMLLLK